MSEPRSIEHHNSETRRAAESLRNAARRVVPRDIRNWLRSPSKSIEWLWDATRYLFGSIDTLAITPDWSVVCHPRAYKIFQRDQVDDPEQSLEFRSFISYCSNDMLLYDIGAHFGIFSLTAAHFGGRAIAVDPSPEAVKMIGIERALNKCTDRVQMFRVAVSDANDVIAMLSSGVFSNGYFKIVSQRPQRELTRVQAITIDHMTLKFGTPTHIKIDVEGHEAAVLRGATVTLKQFSPILFIELHNEMVAAMGSNPCIAVDELRNLDYDIFATDGHAIDKDAILDRPIIRVIAKRRAVNDEGLTLNSARPSTMGTETIRTFYDK